MYTRYPQLQEPGQPKYMQKMYKFCAQIIIYLFWNSTTPPGSHYRSSLFNNNTIQFIRYSTGWFYLICKFQSVFQKQKLARLDGTVTKVLILALDNSLCSRCFFMLGTRSAIGKVSHFPLFGQTQFTQLTAAIILRSLLFFDYEPRYPPSPALSIVRSHSVHLCSRCAKPNYMACNKGRSKFSYNLWGQRIKKREGEGEANKKAATKWDAVRAAPISVAQKANQHF